MVEEDKGGQGACWLSVAQTLSCPTHGLQKREEGDYVFILENKDTMHMAGLGAVSHSHCVSISESSQWLCQWGNVFEGNF